MLSSQRQDSVRLLISTDAPYRSQDAVLTQLREQMPLFAIEVSIARLHKLVIIMKANFIGYGALNDVHVCDNLWPRLPRTVS